MIYSIVLPLLVGGMGVLQNTVNKKLATGLGLPLTLLINNLSLLTWSLVLLLAMRFIPRDALPELFKQKIGLQAVNWKYTIPGTFGFLIIFALPYMIEKVGASRVFIGIIAAQVLVSLLWDALAESVSVSPLRIAGAVLSCAGAILASL